MKEMRKGSKSRKRCKMIRMKMKEIRYKEDKEWDKGGGGGRWG